MFLYIFKICMFSYIVFFNVPFRPFLLIYMEITPAVFFYIAGDGEGGGGPFWDNFI